MQSYGSLHSPSLRKMETSRQYGSGSSHSRFSTSNIIGDPFFMITSSLAFIGWLIAFVSSIIGQASDDAFPKYSWTALILTLGLNVNVVFIVGRNVMQTYHIAVVGYSAAGIVMTTSLVNTLIYSRSGTRVAAGVGFMILAMTEIGWVFYFGTAPSATPRAFIDSFALSKEPHPMSRNTMNAYGIGGRPETSTSVQPPQMYTSAQLNGFENPASVGGISATRNSSAPNNGAYPSSPQPAKLPGSATPTADTEVVPPTEYPYRAKAIYSYDANPDDANEISFTKHEILEVSDVSGRWWQARKETGETGIAPSNYLILL
jgi:SHO1 osmosensor